MREALDRLRVRLNTYLVYYTLTATRSDSYVENSKKIIKRWYYPSSHRL